MTGKSRRPMSVMLSKRANVFYLEHVRIKQKDGRIVWINDSLSDFAKEFEPYYNLPDKNTVFIMIGKGSSITDAAIRLLSESGVVIGFSGSGGTPLLSAVDPVFMLPQSEYRPTEYMQKWCEKWFVESKRIEMAKCFLSYRIDQTIKSWSQMSLTVPSESIALFKKSIERSENTMELLISEAKWAKSLYRYLANLYDLNDFRRAEGKMVKSSKEEKVNSYLDHGNYMGYGYATATLYTLGISFAFPLLHGKTRRGALVFDVADLFKDAYIMPLAFEYGVKKSKDSEFRAAVIKYCNDKKLLDNTFSFVKSVAVS